MICICDACGKVFNKELKLVNAKEWNKNLCITPLENSYSCNIVNCKYNIEGEVCIEFYFCKKCLSNKSIMDKIFQNVKPFNFNERPSLP
jgi:hypothetical protein